MSDRKLRASLIKLAYENPELRADLLPLIKEGGDNSTFKCPKCDSKVLEQTSYCVKCKKKVKKSSGSDLADMVMPSADVMDAAYKLDEGNRQLLMDVYDELRERISVDRGTLEALHRLMNVVGGHTRRPDDIRNQLAKAANQLGLKTPLSF